MNIPTLLYGIALMLGTAYLLPVEQWQHGLPVIAGSTLLLHLIFINTHQEG